MKWFSTIRHVLIALWLLAAGTIAGTAQMDGHGPDAWQVTGVAADDMLNVRSGPGTDYRVIDTLAHNATGVRMITCVPLLSQQQYFELTEAQRASLPARWCLVERRDQQAKGWVSAHYLQEDVSGSQTESDQMIDEAIGLVRDLYERSRKARSSSIAGPLHPAVARDYFFSDIVAQLANGNVGANPLYNAQDTQISDLKIFAPAEHAMFRGRVTVHATFKNFGRPQEVVFHLRVDGSLAEPALRIMQIEHDNWIFP
jgi:hypothetical protein